MSEKQSKHIVYYVHEGRMRSGWIVGRIHFDPSVESSATTPDTMSLVHEALFPDMRGTPAPEPIRQMTQRPGEWLFLSGDALVHSADCFDNRKTAALDYYNRLIHEE